MKVIITGSLGHISKPLAEQLVQEGHMVTVVSSKPEKQKDIEALGATAAIGSLEDVDFLTATFTGADAVYCMVPPNNYFNHNLDLLSYYRGLGHNYAKAIDRSGVRRVVNLSTIGAHMEKGSGILLGAHDVEQILNDLSLDVAITHIRPTAFYYNLYGYTGMIREQGLIAANYGADRNVVWVSPKDIAACIAEEIVTPFAGRKVRYISSDERTGDETASILGAAIGIPGLKWTLLTNEQTQSGLNAAGMNPQIAAGLVEMYASIYDGVLLEDYYLNKPAVMGKVKLESFAEEFADAFTQK